MKARMKADATDRSEIGQQLQEPIFPLDSSTYSDVNIVQIYGGRIATDPTVNIHEAVSMGTDTMKHCESQVFHPGWDLEEHFLKVHGTTITKTHIHFGSAKVYDTSS